MTHTNKLPERRPGLTAVMSAAIMAIGLSFVLPSFAYADPPSWAPAWGWRAKQGDYNYGYGSKHGKKHKQNYDDDDYDYDYDDDGDRIIYRRDVVRCDSRRRDGSIGDLAGVLIDRALGVPEYGRDNCYLSRSDERRGLLFFDPNLN
ncbi:MAG: hypothetical protein ACREEE_10680 [Dongiaceae bacterium]